MEYQKMYLILFQAITDTLEALEQDNKTVAKCALLDAQLQTEAYYMEQAAL